MKMASRKNLKIVITVTLTFVLFACSGEKTTQEYLDAADSFVKSGEFRAALIETRNAVSQSPDNASARALLGTLEAQNGNPSAAETELLKAVELGTPESEVALSLAKTYFQLGKFDELGNLNPNPLEDTEKAAILGYQAEAALTQGDLSESNALSTAALVADAVSPVALTAKARLQLIESNVPTARTYLSTALDSGSDYSKAWELLGDIETSEQRLPEALNAYTRAVATAVNVPTPLFKRARTNLALDDLASATADLEVFENAGVKSPNVGLLKTEILLREGKLPEAQQALEESLRNAPEYIPSVRTIAIIHLLRGTLGQSEQYAKQYFDATDSDDSHVLLAAIRLQAGRLQQAEDTLEPLAESGRLSLLGSQVLATTQMKLGNLDRSVNTMLHLHSNLQRAGITEPTPLALETSPAALLGNALLGKDTIGRATAQDYLTADEKSLLAAVTALTTGATSKAFKYAQGLLESRSDSADIHTLIARIHSKLEDQEGATAALDKALALDKNHATANVLAAITKTNARDYDTARGLLQTALANASGPDRTQIFLGLASVEAANANEERALEWLRQAHNENKSAYQPALAIAYHRARQSDVKGVLSALSELSSPARQNSRVVELLSQAHIAREDYETAIGLISPKVQSEPQVAMWRFLRAKAHAGANNLEDVSRDLDIALRIDPEHAPSKLAKANLSIFSDDLQQAEFQLSGLETLIPGTEALSKLSERVETARQREIAAPSAQVIDNPKTTEQIMETAKAHWSNGDPDKAIRALESWLSKNPDDITIALTLGNTLSTMGRSDEAARAFQQVLESNDGKDNFVALNNLAWQLRNDAPDRAVDYAQRAVALQPENVSVLDTLAMIQYEQGKLDEAGETVKAILSLNPKNPTIKLHVAIIKHARGNFEAAKNLLEPLISDEIGLTEADPTIARDLYNSL